jgi:GDPmannose 4,6-dehydratase
MWKILQQDVAEDFVIATGITTPVREFVRMAFAEVGVHLEFSGTGINEKGYVLRCEKEEYDLQVGRVVVAVDPAYFRPTEVELLIGDSSKARRKLNWEPVYSLQMLVQEMMQNDLDIINRSGTNLLLTHSETF